MKIKIRPYEASIIEEDWLAAGDWPAELRAMARAEPPAALWNRDDALAEVTRLAGAGISRTAGPDPRRRADGRPGRPARARMAPQAAWRTSWTPAPP
jgi:hypothetical protein